MGLLSLIHIVIMLYCPQKTVFSDFPSLKENPGKVIHSSFIDGKGLVAENSTGRSKKGSIEIDGKKEKSENILEVSSFWDKDSLYFFFNVQDKDLRAYQSEQDHPKLYLDDMVEVLIDPQNDKDSCWNEDDMVYHVNILGIKKDDRGTPSCETNPGWNGNAGISVKILGTLNDTTDVDTGYVVKLSISWGELSLHPRKGLGIGINFANGDNDGKGRQLFDWVGAWPMRSPYAYGKLTLTKNHNKK
jgi:hypothetical protein